jgi:SAM-dependent methyltransferase
MSSTPLTERSTHFDFGKNWSDYASLISDDRIEAAVESVKRLVPEIAGKSFLDIGSGSGLFSLAALRLGASEVFATDIDEDSVETTRRVLTDNASGGHWKADRISVFDLPDKKFDVVYSWGVLHHTGDMWAAIRKAASLVRPGGTFVFSLYEKTPLCSAWRVEKRIYSRAPKVVQKVAQGLYLAAYSAGVLATRRNPFRRLKNRRRGMNGTNDVHDWLGGYPYESADASEVETFMRNLGFTRKGHNPVKVNLAGLLGTGCSEYVYVRS